MNLKLNLLAATLAVAFSSPVFAEQEVLATSPQFASHEATLLFEEDTQPLQLVELTSQEMKDTEGAILPIVISPFLVSAAAGLASYTAPIIASSIFNEGAFKDNFSNSWSTSEAAFNTAVGSLTGGIAGNVLIRAGVTIYYPSTTFLKYDYTATQQFVNNQIRKMTYNVGLAVTALQTTANSLAKRGY